MTAITVPTADTTAQPTSNTGSVWKIGVRAGITAAVATTVIAVAATAIDVPVEIDGEAIPALGFAQLTLFFTAVGVGIARLCRGHRSRFVKVTVALTALSLVPDLTVSATTATRLTLMLTHLVAAAIVIPALAARLADDRNA